MCECDILGSVETFPCFLGGFRVGGRYPSWWVYSVDCMQYWNTSILGMLRSILYLMWEHYGCALLSGYTDREEIKHCLAKLSIDRNPDGSISDVQSTIHVKYK